MGWSLRGPDLFREDCPKCYGTLMYPTPWIGFHAHMVACECPAGVELDDRLRKTSPVIAATAADALYVDADGREMRLWGGNGHRLSLLVACGRAAWVDEKIAPVVRTLWEHGIWTWVSCEGDDHVTPYIGLADGARLPEALPLLPWPASEVTCWDRDLRQYVKAASVVPVPGCDLALYGPHPPDCECVKCPQPARAARLSTDPVAR